MVERQEADWEVDIGHMMSTAIGLQRIVKELQEKIDEGADLVMWRGVATASPMLLSFAVELGLKALHRMAGTGAPKKDHNLLELYKRLDDKTRDRLRKRMRACEEEFERTEGGLFVGDRMWVVLERYKNLFKDWRYRVERPEWNSWSPDELNEVMDAISETYDEMWASVRSGATGERVMRD